ncbi:MAG: ABC transporter ATP-binding protein [Armatimonadetes bacterium]|nr:ABC transporter ATP-binding protein [Armatimonadota bacterium]
MIADGVLIEVRDLARHFAAGHGRVVRAVDGLSFDIARGETLGLVGESGCGKSTLGRLIARLEEPTRGQVLFDGVDLTALPPAKLRPLRPRIQVIFQDPYASLNPHKTVRQIVGLPLRVRGGRANGQVRERVLELIGMVGLDPEHAGRFPHQFSGGQRQRIGIARALAAGPELIIADEPVASLDVSIQAQILQVLRELQQRLGLTLLFISHDLSVVSHISHRVAVMYLGKIVEIGPAQSVIQEPRHPYTRALLAATPRLEPGARRSTPLAGDVPSPMAVPPGCRFHTRCPLAITEECRRTESPLRELAPGHRAACHLA